LSFKSLNGCFRAAAQYPGIGCVDPEQAASVTVLAGSVPLHVNACVAGKLAFARDMAIL
jgi:hypothetical protein